jgi:CheY-like chemotaxis protein
VDLTEVVGELARLAGSTVPKKCALELDLAQGLPAVEADLAQLRQVVLNLITNAAEAVGDRPGRVVVRTRPCDCDPAELAQGPLGAGLHPGRYVALEVVDDGCGMSPEVQARIFDPFFSTKFTGRGLGLAAVLGILRGHQGALQITSAPGQGSTFRVLLPASVRAAESILAPAAPAPPPPDDATVLVVDDEEMVLRGAQRFLTRAGYQVLVARDGRAGVDQFRAAAGRVQAVLLDLSMPGMDGFEVMRALREIRADTPIVLTSGYSEVDLAEQMRGASLPPPAAFLQKPYDTQVLLAEQQRLLPRGPGRPALR